MANPINLNKRKVCGKALCPWMEKLSQIGRSYPWNSKETGLEGNLFCQINSYSSDDQGNRYVYCNSMLHTSSTTFSTPKKVSQKTSYVCIWNILWVCIFHEFFLQNFITKEGMTFMNLIYIKAQRLRYTKPPVSIVV